MSQVRQPSSNMGGTACAAHALRYSGLRLRFARVIAPLPAPTARHQRAVALNLIVSSGARSSFATSRRAASMRISNATWLPCAPCAARRGRPRVRARGPAWPSALSRRLRVAPAGAAFRVHLWSAPFAASRAIPCAAYTVELQAWSISRSCGSPRASDGAFPPPASNRIVRKLVARGGRSRDASRFGYSAGSLQATRKAQSQ